METEPAPQGPASVPTLFWTHLPNTQGGPFGLVCAEGAVGTGRDNEVRAGHAHPETSLFGRATLSLPGREAVSESRGAGVPHLSAGLGSSLCHVTQCFGWFGGSLGIMQNEAKPADAVSLGHFSIHILI